MPSTYRVNGAAIRAIRERSEMSMVDFASAVTEHTGQEVHPQTLRKIEIGSRQPTPPLMGAIAKALKVPKIAILCDPEEEPPS